MNKLNFVVALLLIAALVGCGDGAESNVAESPAVTSPSASTRVDTPTPVVSPAAEVPGSLTPTVAVEPVETPVLELPSGAVAFFYRVSFENASDELSISVDGAVSVVEWEKGAKGIARWVPETGAVDVIKLITTSSFSPSSIYPVTVGGRLYAVRDWGSDWTSDNKHFTVEELDPVSGRSLGSVDFNAEWFTISGDEVIYREELRTNLFGAVTGGGDIFVVNLSDGSSQELAEAEGRLRAVGDAVVSLDGTVLREHSVATGAVTGLSEIDAGLVESRWPWSGRIFQGDSALWWASEVSASEIAVVSAQPGGAVQSVLSVDPEGDVDIVIDEGDGLLLIGGIDSSGTRGLAVTSVSVVDMESGDVTEYEVEEYIGSSDADAGGGLQVMRLP